MCFKHKRKNENKNRQRGAISGRCHHAAMPCADNLHAIISEINIENVLIALWFTLARFAPLWTNENESAWLPLSVDYFINGWRAVKSGGRKWEWKSIYLQAICSPLKYQVTCGWGLPLTLHRMVADRFSMAFWNDGVSIKEMGSVRKRKEKAIKWFDLLKNNVASN